MANYSNIEMDVFSLVALFIIFKNMSHSKGNGLPDQKFFNIMIFSSAAMMFLNIIQWLANGKTAASVRLILVIAVTLNYIHERAPYFIRLTAGYGIFECGVGLPKTMYLTR